MVESSLVLSGYDIELSRLSHDKIEMVRQWRNDPRISQYMLYQETITQEMQEKWFVKVNNDNNLYFIVEYKGQDVGLINVKDIDYIKKTGEGGIFIYDENLQDTDIAYRAHILLFDYVFDKICLETISSEIQPTNRRAIRFATFLGCELVKETPECLFFILTKEKYLSNNNRKRFLKRWNYYNK